jgi:ATP-binding cassette subfamily C protein
MKYQIVQQHSEEDCGAACIAAIAKHYERTFTLNRTREAVGTGQLGTTLLGIRRGAEALGFNAQSVRASSEVLDKINAVPLPAIIHWKGNHWVVLYGQQGKKYVIADPAVGIRYLSRNELTEGWKNWVMLLLQPDSVRFSAQLDEKVGGFGRFVRRVWPYRAMLFQALLCAQIIGLLSLAYPFLIQILTDDVLVRGDLRLLNAVVITVVAINIVNSGLRLIANNLIANFAQRLELGLVLEFGRQILRLPLTYYENRRSGEVVSRLQDIQEINQLVSQVVVSLPTQFFIALVSFGFMLFYSGKLTLAAVVIAVLMTLSTVVFLPTLQQKTRSLLVLEAENQGVLVESFKGALTLKTTTAAPQFWEEFQSRFGRLANTIFRTIQIGIINSTFSGLVSGIGGVALLWFGSTLVISKELSIGQLLAFNAMNGNFLAFIGTLIGFVDELTRVKTATERLTEVIDATPETKDDTKKAWAKIPGNVDITCTNLNFHYPGRLELLEDFSLKIPGGQVIALIGKSGCGKSSLAKMIAGLYTPQSGNIRVGIYNLEDLSLDSLRQQLVLVPQEPHFWSRSIVENFRLGTPHVTFEQIVTACQIAEADDFISKLPDKYQTVLGEFGSNISGGQRQRLAIARAIVNDPPVLILDESTAGLDPVSETQVLDKLLFHRQGKTTIVISHRPRVINRADWIVLLDQGQLKLQGSLEDLRSKAGDHLDFLTP